MKQEEMIGLGSCDLSASDVEYNLQEEYGQNSFSRITNKWIRGITYNT